MSPWRGSSSSQNINFEQTDQNKYAMFESSDVKLSSSCFVCTLPCLHFVYSLLSLYFLALEKNVISIH
jgi:hypothetical protein